MSKLMYLVLGLLAVTGTALMVTASPLARGTATPGQDAMDIRALERTVDHKALPKTDLDPAVYQ